MFCYKRKTAFIEYYINGIKSRCVGIVKQKLTAEELWLNIELYGLEDWKNMVCKVSVGNAEERQPLFDMEVCAGKSAGEYRIPLKCLRQTGYKKIFFACGNDCYGIADLCELPDLCKLSEVYELSKVSLTSVETRRKVNDMAEEFLSAEEDNESIEVGQITSAEVCLEKDLREQSSKGRDNERKECADTEATDWKEDAGAQETELLTDCLEPQPDKWEVIKKKYPILYPFKGQGPYVSIKPVDLQLLDRKYHHLSSNSYLMHAFYQYRHMILGEYAMEQGTFFYVGVPGEFIKKEQNSAAMFGFEGYEHSGDLGYYLYRVEL